MATTFPQGSKLIAQSDARFQNPASRRYKKIIRGGEYWVANTETDQQRINAVEICKRGEQMGSGFRLPLDSVLTWFADEAEIRENDLHNFKCMMGINPRESGAK